MLFARKIKASWKYTLGRPVGRSVGKAEVSRSELVLLLLLLLVKPRWLERYSFTSCFSNEYSLTATSRSSKLPKLFA